MAAEAHNRPVALHRTTSNHSFSSLPLSYASSSSLLKSETITNPYPLKGRDVVIELGNQQQDEELRRDIRKLGGRIVENIDENKLPFVVISDHPGASRLEMMKGVYNDKMILKDLPLILKQAVRSNVKVRSYVTFQQQFARFKSRIRSAKSLTNAPQKRSAKMVDGSVKEKKVRLLKRPFIKWQDSRKHYAPSYKECSTPRWTTVYFGPAAGNCVFRRVTAEQLERRKREGQLLMPEDSDPPSSPGREKSVKSGKSVKINRTVKTPRNKFCDLCNKAFDDMEQHYDSKEHMISATQPGMYDEVDLCVGSVVDHVVCPAALSSVRLPDITPMEDEPTFPPDGARYYESSEGNYEFTLLNKN
ncbi:hypothetical protein KIN20_025762 [Parelaphostrongylus tenuis]|uniref:DBF4-type domain-containing protein n=1 Tax=Parelaphostrongylus tenuis TaxID=148309 RepID=A0AAD5QXU0_PARTN|nr:hypothetical protein KIN20_025762 [Parelaphostrongylus tenuis]